MEAFTTARTVKPFANYHEFWRWVDSCRWTLPKGAVFMGKSDLFWPYDEHGLDGVAHRAALGIEAATNLIEESRAAGRDDMVAHYDRLRKGWVHIFECAVKAMEEAK